MIGKPSIQPGVVVHMHPEALAAGGGATNAPADIRVKDVHYFLCLDRKDESAKWLPCYTDNGPGREPIQTDEKTGHPGWTSGVSYYHPTQIWDAPHDAAIEAALAGNDLSKPSLRNRVTKPALDRAREHAGIT